MPIYIQRWLCAHGYHRWLTVRVLTGGAGPDDAAEEVECTRCKQPGWKWLDGSYSLSAAALR